MAMSHQQLSAEDQARIWYGKALDWRKDNTPGETLQGHYSEAAKLLVSPQENKLNASELP